MTTSKKKRVSKKNKSSWRKHADIKDVEEFLHEQAEEERLGSISLKNDADLFTVDTVTTPDTITEYSPKQKRKLNALKKPKNLGYTSNIQETTKTKHQEVVFPLKHLRKAVRGIEKRQGNVLRIKGRKFKRGVSAFVKDIWDGDVENDKTLEYQNEWISKALTLHHLHGTGKQLVKVHESAHHKTTRAKAFQPPHPGISYNPSHEDYQNLIENVIVKEEKIIKEKKHLDRVTTKMFSAVPVEDCERFKSCEEFNEDININEDNKIITKNGEWEVEEIPVEIVHKENKKKTRKERTKQKKVKELQKEQKLKKERKKQITDLHRLRSIAENVDKEEQETKELVKHRKIQKEKKKFEPKRLSKTKFEEPDMDIMMPNELPDNLRKLKCDSKLIVDKFKDFQKRNLLPVSVDVGTRKRRKIKRFVRKSHKESEI